MMDNAANGNGKDRTWRDCSTMHELGDMDRPSVVTWFRHLARIPVPVQEPFPAPAAD